jgi:hypothetical protein
MLILAHPHDVLELIRHAKQRVDRTSDRRVLTLLDIREARAFAALGRGRTFERAPLQAREHLAAGLSWRAVPDSLFR